MAAPKKRRPGGGRKKSPTARSGRYVMVRLTAIEREHAETRAEAEGTSLAGLLRTVLDPEALRLCWDRTGTRALAVRGAEVLGRLSLVTPMEGAVRWTWAPAGGEPEVIDGLAAALARVRPRTPQAAVMALDCRK